MANFNWSRNAPLYFIILLKNWKVKNSKFTLFTNAIFDNRNYRKTRKTGRRSPRNYVYTERGWVCNRHVMQKGGHQIPGEWRNFWEGKEKLMRGDIKFENAKTTKELCIRVDFQLYQTILGAKFENNTYVYFNSKQWQINADLKRKHDFSVH